LTTAADTLHAARQLHIPLGFLSDVLHANIRDAFQNSVTVPIYKPTPGLQQQLIISQ
jgi:hypothetical protein